MNLEEFLKAYHILDGKREQEFRSYEEKSKPLRSAINEMLMDRDRKIEAIQDEINNLVSGELMDKAVKIALDRNIEIYGDHIDHDGNPVVNDEGVSVFIDEDGEYFREVISWEQLLAE